VEPVCAPAARLKAPPPRNPPLEYSAQLVFPFFATGPIDFVFFAFGIEAAFPSELSCFLARDLSGSGTHATTFWPKLSRRPFSRLRETSLCSSSANAKSFAAAAASFLHRGNKTFIIHFFKSPSLCAALCRKTPAPSLWLLCTATSVASALESPSRPHNTLVRRISSFHVQSGVIVPSNPPHPSACLMKFLVSVRGASMTKGSR
jgi:hypothetical protein